MRFDAFDAMVRRMAREVPAEFLAGIVGIEVSPKTLPDPVRPGVYTLGECIAVPAEHEDAAEIQSRLVLYHGSFLALAGGDIGFDWRGQAWETLTHELRHHLEWRARVSDLERFDEAADQNFARVQGEPFGPLFHLQAEAVAPGVTRIDDDFFIDQPVGNVPTLVRFAWHGAAYRVTAPAGATLPAFLTVLGVQAPPPGDLVVVLRRIPRLLDLFRPSPPPYRATVRARRE
jgi:hypothetical protein